jgi:type 1 glutamine amidotransferase
MASPDATALRGANQPRRTTPTPAVEAEPSALHGPPAVGRSSLHWLCWRVLAMAVGGVLLLASIADCGLADEQASARPQKKLLLVGQSPDAHPAGSHEYLPGLRILAALLKDTPDVHVQVVNADEPWADGPQLLRAADGVVLFVSEGARWLSADARRQQAFGELASRGGALCVLHWGMGTRSAEPIGPFVRLFGGCHGGPDRKYAIVEVQAVPADHQAAAGIDPFRVKDEFYYRLKWIERADDIQPLLQVPIDHEDHTVAWCWQRPDGGRSFGFSGLHFHDNWRLPEYRRLVVQGVLWTLRLPIPEEGVAVDLDPDLLKLPR